MLQPKVAERGVVITGIANPLLQATARTVQVAVATADNRRRSIDPARHHLTRQGLDRTIGWLDTYEATPQKPTPLSKLTNDQLALLTGPSARTNFAELHKLIDQAEAARADQPFFRDIPIDEITNVEIATCASAIALYYGEVSPRRALTSGQLDAAYDELKRSTEPGFAPSEAFAAASTHAEFKREHVEALNVYMRTGMGGLMSRGSIEGSGYQFDRVFRLPRLAHIELPENKPFDQQPEAKQQKYLIDTIAAYKVQFAKTGFDCVYVVGDDKQIYVALHDKGALTRIRQGASVAFIDPSRYHDPNATWQLGRVDSVIDVNNTWHEASIGMWTRIGAGWADAANNLFRSVTEKPLETLTQVSGRLPTDPAKLPPGTNPIFLAAGVAGVVTAFQGADMGPVIGIGAAAFVGITTALSVWNVSRVGKDITPFLEATGHVINTAAMRADDI